MLNRICEVCQSTENKFLFRQNFSEIDGAKLISGYDVVVCRQCGFSFASNIPQQEAFDNYYKELSKYEYQERGGRESLYDLKRFENISNTIHRQLLKQKNSFSSRILDIGCSTGRLLKLLKDKGYTHVFGLDPSPVCARLAKKLYDIDVFIDSLFTFKTEVKFDVIILIGVLEHIKDLRLAIKNIQNLLSSNGLVYLEVPDATRFCFYEDAPFQQFSIEHINFFSPQSLDNFMNRNNFELIRYEQVEREHSKNTIMPCISGFWKVNNSLTLANIQKDTESEDKLIKYINQSIKVENRIKDIIEQLVNNQKPIFVWGTGTHTLRLLETTNLGQANIIAFIDSNPKYQEKYLKGIPILSPSAIKNKDYPIFISTRVMQEEIVSQIKDELLYENDLNP